MKIQIYKLIKVILVKLKWNTPLYKVDEFVTKFKKKNSKRKLKVDVKLTETNCLICFF